MSNCENPSVEKDALMTRRLKFDGKTKVCVKCKENTGNVVIRYAVYCKTCFFPLIQTRFKKSLEPSINPLPDGPRRKALKAAGSLVVGFSGGTCSTALLDILAKTYFTPRQSGDDLLKGGKDHPRNTDRGVWTGIPVACYVEVCGAFDKVTDRTERIRAAVENYPGSPFEFVSLRLEDCFDATWWKRVGGGDISTAASSLGLNLTDEDLRFSSTSYLSPDSSPLTRLRSYLSGLPTQTAFHSAIQNLIRLLLLHTAASRCASHLLLGTSLTSLSVNLISGIAQGTGFSVAEEAKEEWTPRPARGLSVRIIRPMMDIGMKECAIWNWWIGLLPVGSSIQAMGGRNAIGSLTRDFIFGLEADYPATVSTIARTCAKLAPKERSDATCALCERPSQPGIQAWKAQISIRSYSEAPSAVSGNTRPPHLTEEEISNLTEPVLDTSISYPTLTPHLCYACHTLLTSRSSRGTSLLTSAATTSHVALPVWVAAIADTSPQRDSNEGEFMKAVHGHTMSRTDMQAHIGGFLLADDE